MLPAFLDLVEKLNEATFKPLFSRLYDWAVISPEESSEGKCLCVRRRGYTVLHLHIQSPLHPAGRSAYSVWSKAC